MAVDRTSLLSQSIHELTYLQPITQPTFLTSDGTSSAIDQELWVSKYYPQSFSQLLSSEYVNRNVLKAVKEWDAFVFHRNHDDKSMRNLEEEDSDSKAEDKRPVVKMILIAGPPGSLSSFT